MTEPLKRPYFAVYEIECITPNHKYVGFSGRVEQRLGSHLLGQGAMFTRRHGVKSAKVISTHATVEEAKLAEQAHYRVVKGQGFQIRM